VCGVAGVFEEEGRRRRRSFTCDWKHANVWRRRAWKHPITVLTLRWYVTGNR